MIIDTVCNNWGTMAKKVRKSSPAPLPNGANQNWRSYTGTGILAICALIGGLSFLHLQKIAESTSTLSYNNTLETTIPAPGVPPFPVSVDPIHKTITETSLVESYYTDHVAVLGGNAGAQTNWFGKVFARLALSGWFQNLASLSTRTLVIQSGERKEEVANNFAKILGWNSNQKSIFTALIASSTPALVDGNLFPGTYIVERKAPPEVVAPMVTERFEQHVLARYTTEVSDLVPLNDALVLASLLEREAYDFEDMREISGVIWNRLFTDMNLQLDASLQYAKANAGGSSWWPSVRPVDKYIESPWNTYENKGLPPSAIANPSLDAIIAALNPKKTDCMFYFHDKKGGFHCTETYKEHVAALKQYYGRGK